MEKTLHVEESRLFGQCSVSGSKHAFGRALVASVLTDGVVTLENAPTHLRDAEVAYSMLRALGKRVDVHPDADVVVVDGSGATDAVGVLPRYETSIRTTLLLLAGLVAKVGFARVPLPGGCDLGSRPFDLHAYVLERLGATVWSDAAFVYAATPRRLRGTTISLPLASNGATEAAVFASSLACGRSIVTGGHVTPELLDLINMLRAMGAQIEVASESTIIVDGVTEVAGARHQLMSDTSEAITLAIAAGMTAGEIVMTRAPVAALAYTLYALEKIGLSVEVLTPCALRIGGGDFNPFAISATRYPGIASDVQPLFALLATAASGVSLIRDERQPRRFWHVPALARFGADVDVRGDVLYVSGPRRLCRAHVDARDIRTGATVLIAALAASGSSQIDNAEQIDRGFDDLPGKLRMLGGKIEVATAAHHGHSEPFHRRDLEDLPA